MKRLVVRLLFVLLLASPFLIEPGVWPTYAAGYVVTTLADNTTADNLCSLREAILAANNVPANGDCGPGSAGDDTVTFSVSGTIVISPTLPAIAAGAGALTMDGGGVITISGNSKIQVMVVGVGATLTLQNLTIANGYATNGGGIFNWSTLTVTNCTFFGNSAEKYGGGIFNAGRLNVTSSTFSGNSASQGGGIFNGGRLNVTNSTFFGNSANEGGGGIENAYASDNMLIVTNSTFYLNRAKYGGGINSAGTVNVANSTFSDNSADSDGGGIRSNGILTVTNSTFSGNSANYGGGISNGRTATLKNTIIANSPSGGDCMGTLSGTNINNLIKDSLHACGLTNGVNGNIIGHDPNLGRLTGSPAYFPLLPGSPAIDAGDNATCAASPVNNQSQNGVLRPQDGNGDDVPVCDIGSVEAEAIVFNFRIYLPMVLRN